MQPTTWFIQVYINVFCFVSHFDSYRECFVALIKGRLGIVNNRHKDLSTLSADAAGKLDVLGHDCHPLGVDGAQVGVFEEADEVSL